MRHLSRRRFVGSAVAATVAAAGLPAVSISRAYATGATLTPRKLLYPDADFGSYEPTITADGNSIYFARFGNNGDKRVTGASDLFVTHRTNQSAEWPGKPEDWSPAERLPDAVNSDTTDLEPWISPDGNTLYFMSYREGAGKLAGIWESHKQPDGKWEKAKPVAGGNINTEYADHCFIPFDLPGQPSARSFISIRPRAPGQQPTTDLYTTHQVDGVWQPAQRYEDKLLDSIALKCRLNVVTWDGLTLGVVTVHDFGKFHTLLFVHYDPESETWKGPIVEAPFNDWNIDGGCVNFQGDGERMIWSAGYDRGPGLITGGPTGGGGVFDLYWLPTSEVVAYYKARAGLS